MKKAGIILFITILMAGTVSMAHGHMLWINADNQSPNIGENVTIEIGFGHTYPHIETVKEDNIERVYALDPEGRELPLEKVSPAKFRFIPQSEGQYEIIAKLKKGFVSVTPDGRKLGNKKTLNNVVSCLQFNMSAKTMIRVGSKGKRSSHPGEVPLEIVLIDDIGSLKTGKELSLRVYFNGKPIKGVNLQAVDADTAQQKEDTWAQEATSDANGTVRIKPAAKGQWLFAAGYETPYQDLEECDKHMYRATLTLSVR